MKTQFATRLFPCFAASIAFCLLTGCASQQTPNPKATATEVERENPAQTPAKNVLSSDQVPDRVKRAFQAKFPMVNLVEWKIKSDKNYEAEFTLRQTGIAAKFDLTGKWLETESAIPLSQVPQAVQATATRKFTGYQIVEMQILVRWNEQQPIYELHLDSGKVVVKAQFSGDGAILNQSTKPKS